MNPRARFATYRIDEVKPASRAVITEVIKEDREVKERTKCTVCGTPQQWSQLEPGTGRCTKCQP